MVNLGSAKGNRYGFTSPKKYSLPCTSRLYSALVAEPKVIMKKFLYCQNCQRHSWAKLVGVRWICLDCGQEITYSEKGDENVGPEPKSYTQHYPE